MFDGEEYELQEKRDEQDAYYGIEKYDPLQLEFHRDIIRLLKSKKYTNLGADDAMVVFGRVYSVYELSQLQKEGKVKPADDSEQAEGDTDN